MNIALKRIALEHSRSRAVVVVIAIAVALVAAVARQVIKSLVVAGAEGAPKKVFYITFFTPHKE